MQKRWQRGNRRLVKIRESNPGKPMAPPASQEGRRGCRGGLPSIWDTIKSVFK
jgi:hypothetical protein